MTDRPEPRPLTEDEEHAAVRALPDDALRAGMRALERGDHDAVLAILLEHNPHLVRRDHA